MFLIWLVEYSWFIHKFILDLFKGCSSAVDRVALKKGPFGLGGATRDYYGPEPNLIPWSSTGHQMAQQQRGDPLTLGSSAASTFRGLFSQILGSDTVVVDSL